jgi:predicted nucleic acid-binding protein
MRVLADTSVWVEHLRAGSPTLSALLDETLVVVHPFVIGELACGNLRNRTELLDPLAKLPRAAVATQEEALQFIENHRLMGRGIGYVDVHLLASVALQGDAQLWTLDRRLAKVAAELRLATTQGK